MDTPSPGLREAAAEIRSHADCGSVLPPYRHPAIGGPPQGAVLLHGGFDSLIEEFFAVSQRIAAAGYVVIAFEGAGQGGARALGGLTFDHFELHSAASLGISMGGCWALRAPGASLASTAW